MKKILIVEDDLTLGRGLMMALKNQDTQVTVASTIKDAGQELKADDFDLMLLDINLPDGNGLDFMAKVKKTANLPVILLTANDTEMDIVNGFELGARDYVTKPFSLAVLRARVNAQLSMEETGGAAGHPYRQEQLYMDFDKMEFRKGDLIIELSKTEQRLLKVLVENRGHTLSREKLMDYVWPYGTEFVDENTLSVTIKRLRDKIENNPAKPENIKTVYGLGYVWAVEK